MVAAIRAFHRSELDAAARMHESFGTITKAEELASRRVRIKRDCSRLWTWCHKRWGAAWTQLEYDMRYNEGGIEL